MFLFVLEEKESSEMVGEPQDSSRLRWIPLACSVATDHLANVSLGLLGAAHIFHTLRGGYKGTILFPERSNVSNILAVVSFSRPEMNPHTRSKH